MHACMLSRISRVRLCVTPWTAARQAPLFTEFSRQEYWSGVPFPPPILESVCVHIHFSVAFSLKVSSYGTWCPFLDVPSYRTIVSFQITKLRPRGRRPPPSPPQPPQPPPARPPSSRLKAPSVPTQKKNLIWLGRNVLSVSRSSLIREA